MIPPYGMNGGREGKVGQQRMIRKDGSERKLSWWDGADLEPGDMFILETPGGGGSGKTIY